MGKTVPSYRMALEDEIGRWKLFRDTLPDAKSQETFDWMMDMCRNNAAASGCACNPIIFEPMTMSILLAQQLQINELKRKIEKLEHQIHDAIWEEICTREKKEGKANDNSAAQT